MKIQPSRITIVRWIALVLSISILAQPIDPFTFRAVPALAAASPTIPACPFSSLPNATSQKIRRGVQFGDLDENRIGTVIAELKCSGATWTRIEFINRVNGTPTDLANRYGSIIQQLQANPNPVQVIGLLDSRAGFGDNFSADAGKLAGLLTSVGYWEIWNEPDKNNVDANDYAKLLQDTFSSIRNTAPNAKIISGGIGDTSQHYLSNVCNSVNGQKWPNRVFPADYVGIHIYDPNGRLSSGINDTTSDMRTCKIQNGQIFITEVGWPTQPHFNDKTHIEDGDTPSEQAKAVTYSYSYLPRNVKAAVWFFLQDVRGPDENMQYHFIPDPSYQGLLYSNGSPKPSWCAFVGVSTSKCQASVAGEPNPSGPIQLAKVISADATPVAPKAAMPKGTISQIALHTTTVGQASTGSTLLLNMGSEERRMERGIQVNEINESFVVTQLSATLPGDFSVSAFGVTQIYSGIMNILADGDDGNDVITLESAAPAEIYGGTGDDQIQSGAGDDILSGDEGNDVISGGDGSDVIDGGDGADVLNGEGGDDSISGGPSNDSLDGGSGNDILSGDEGNDSLFGGDGADALYGDDGDDTLSGGGGDDTLEGAEGADNMHGGDGNDSMYGNNGPDQMYGDGGQDTMYGNAGDDGMSGGTGDDYMEGNEGSDSINGDAGVDDMLGGNPTAGTPDGRDAMHGGDGVDVMAGDNARITRTADGSRQVKLFDVAAVGGPAVSPAASGSDWMFGDAGNDRLFGQGNGAAADTVGMDPPDGVDNDRNGRENSSSSGPFDCLDGRDNDGDGKIDTADPQCAAAIDNNPGGDEMHGGPGDDYMEGNQGSDWMFGDGGEDDMLGGSSAGNGIIGGPVAPAGLRDGNDVMNGNGEDDVMLGDNGQIIRPVAANGLNKRLTGGAFDLAIRDTRMAQTPEPAGAYGNDWISAGDGVDDSYGQLGDDYMEGNDGEDAMLGDLGKITNNLIGLNDGLPDPGVEQRIAPNAPFFDPGELIYPKGSLYRQVELYAYLSGAGGAGNDTIYGGGGNDAIHGGAGNDILNGNAGDDRLFGGDDSDAIWGGPGHDIMFGGYGIDYLDVLPRPARADKKDSFPADPPTWFEAARLDNYQGLDIMYGGWDRDWMQADVSAPGRTNGDRMIDWVGAFNAYYRCDAAYGDWVITRQHSPSLVAFLQALAQGYGALNTATSGTSGFRETAIVFPTEVKDNANPPNPDNPAHFTCGPSR